MKQRNGFTLIEILVASVVLAVLASVAIISYSSVTKRSRDSKRRSDLEQMRTALEMYRADYNMYPPVNVSGWDTAANLAAYLVTDPYDYMPSIPSDPATGMRYSFKATNGSGGNYYGYCLSAYLEAEDPADTCTDVPVVDAGQDPAHTYSIKNP